MAHKESSALGQANVHIVVPVQASPELQAQAEAKPLGPTKDIEQETNSSREPTSASSLSVEGHSISDTVASSSELDSSGNSMNEASGSPVGLQASAPHER